MSWSRLATGWRAAAVAAVVALALGLGWWAVAGGSRGSSGGSSAGDPTGSASDLLVTPSVSPSAGSTVSPSAGAGALAGCAATATPFVPTRVVVPGVTSGARVVTPPRESGGVPGAPPLTSRGKQEFAYDRAQGIAPGSPSGNVLLNAHTWPDGSALGNRMLATLQVGGAIVVHGATQTLCYRVTQRIEVLASKGYAHYYDRTGPPQLAIVVCSGRRLGPGVWTKRTIWFASPSV